MTTEVNFCGSVFMSRKTGEEMFTVLICDKHIIDDCSGKYYIYLKPFIDNSDFSFCAWNTDGTSLDEAVPQLKNLIRTKKEWRAIVVNDHTTWNFDSVNRINPFDYVGGSSKGGFGSSESVQEFRNEEESAVNKALSNPLMKLSVWLCGVPARKKPEVCYAGLEELVENVGEWNRYLDALREKELSVEVVERDRIRVMQYKRLSEQFDLGGELFDPPASVIAVSERVRDISDAQAEQVWNSHTEFDYSHFYVKNMYPDKLRYLIYDMIYVKGEQSENTYFSFLSVLLVLATNEIPNGVLRANRVYNLGVEVDPEYIKELCNRYNAKLKATIGKIDDMSRRLAEKAKQPVEREVVETLFEANVTVPVTINDNFNINSLMARHDKIGLARNCPLDEYGYWVEQYHTISGLFGRYLKEPRRAVKEAAREGLRTLNEVKDERVLRLDEYQRENILNNLENHEQSMVSTFTTHLYNTEKYKERIEEADKEVKKEIKQRMTKNRTICVGLIALLAYFLGFMPLLFGSLNTVGTFTFSFVMICAALGALALIGVVGLFVMRHRLIKAFKHFNEIMEETIEEINSGLSSFSEYLSHVCNVMRGFSILNYSKISYEKKQNILDNHRRMITERIAEVNELFSRYIERNDSEVIATVQPYNYDFTRLDGYNYEMPYNEVEKRVEFMQTGNFITVPVDYLKLISVTREELYD